MQASIETLKTAPFEAVDPKGEPVEIAQVAEPPPRAAQDLPKTERLRIWIRSKPYHTSKPLVRALRIVSSKPDLPSLCHPADQCSRGEAYGKRRRKG